MDDAAQPLLPGRRRTIAPRSAAVSLCAFAAFVAVAQHVARRAPPTARDAAFAASASAAASSASLEAAASGHPPAQRAPHIVLVTLDDVGMNDFGYQSTDLHGVTPNIDRLAASGVKLANLYGQQLCTPARAALLSGKFVHRIGFGSTAFQPSADAAEITAYSNFSIPLGATLLPQRLSDAGYSTHGFGKWNVGHCNSSYLPTARGFDTFIGYFTAGIGYTSHATSPLVTVPGGANGTSRVSVDDLVTCSGATVSPATSDAYAGLDSDAIFASAATAAIATHGAKLARRESDSSEIRPWEPLFVWLAFHGAHDDAGSDDAAVSAARAGDDDASASRAGAALARVRARGAPEPRRKLAQRMLTLDSLIGGLVDSLRDAGLLDSAVLVVHSDNGGWPCGTHLATSSYPFRGKKYEFFEGGVRVPGFIYAPGLLARANATAERSAAGAIVHGAADDDDAGGAAAAVTDDALYGTPLNATYYGMMHHVDWLATFSSLARGGKSYADDDELDGVDHWHAIETAAARAAARRDGTARDDDDDDGGAELYAKRNELVLDVSESDTVALRVGDFKLLLRAFVDERATYDADGVGNHTGGSCGNLTKADYLFDLKTDPFETRNLVREVAYNSTLRMLTDRALQIAQEQVKRRYDGSHLLGGMSTEAEAARTAFLDAGSRGKDGKSEQAFIVPWGCDVIW